MLKKRQMRLDERILDDVGCRVGCRERDGDDEVCGDEAEQDEYEQFALPTREQVFEHRDRAFAVRAFGGDAVVDGKRPEER